MFTLFLNDPNPLIYPLQTRLYDLHVPLYILTHTKRKTLPNLIVKTSLELNATRIFANMEYEVDELRRDLAVVRLARGGTEPLEATFVADKFIVEPGVLHTKQGKMYKVRPCHLAQLDVDMFILTFRYSPLGLKVGTNSNSFFLFLLTPPNDSVD